MANMNLVVLSGRLTADPELRKGKDDLSICSVTVAVNRPGKDAGADFIRCTAFGQTADIICKYCCKGGRVSVQGRWQTGSYVDKEGFTVYTNDCIIDRLDIIDFAEREEPEEKPERGRSRRQAGRS